MGDAGFDKVRRLCDYWTSVNDPQMRWMWGQALLGYALSELDAFTGEDRYTPFLTAFCDHYVQHQPRVDYADTAAPALITYAMQKKTGGVGYGALTDRVLDYIRHEPRLLGDAVNHLGKSPEGWFYPKSIWVDSLMMFSVFPAIYAKENDDADLLAFAARQPRMYSEYMQCAQDRLWYHSYWVKRQTHYPVGRVFWGRGNGWVMCALPRIMDQIGEAHPEFPGILAIFQETATAVVGWQRDDGAFATVLNHPGKTYRELSATALIADGLLHGVRCGYLDARFLEPGVRAFRAVADSIYVNEQGVFLPEVSAPTIPLPLFPYLCYKWTPRANNLTYGIAAAVFAAIEYETCGRLGLLPLERS